MYVLDALISYFPALELEAKEVNERQSEQEAVANRPLYSNDAMSWGDLTELL
jgi:hypothetical protein